MRSQHAGWHGDCSLLEAKSRSSRARYASREINRAVEDQRNGIAIKPILEAETKEAQ
jgi:hypothetical protein